MSFSANATPLHCHLSLQVSAPGLRPAFEGLSWTTVLSLASYLEALMIYFHYSELQHINAIAVMKTILVGALVGLAVTYAFIRALLQLTQLSNEPPAVSTSIPFIGPILEMARHKSRFHTHVRNKTGLPIYTLRLPGTRMYVVNSPSLVTAVQRLYKTISFGAIEAQITESILLVSKHGKNVVRSGLMEDNSYTGAFAAAIHPATRPGANLDAMNRIALQTIAASLDELQAEGSKSVNLFNWIHDEITLATTDAVYGPHNPLRDQDVRASW